MPSVDYPDALEVSGCSSSSSSSSSSSRSSSGGSCSSMLRCSIAVQARGTTLLLLLLHILPGGERTDPREPYAAMSITRWLSPRPAGSPEASRSAGACLRLPQASARLGGRAGLPYRACFRRRHAALHRRGDGQGHRARRGGGRR
eukprot:scaffold49605_cov54-Phaeocystis_antarctica.AAC.1